MEAQRERRYFIFNKSDLSINPSAQKPLFRGQLKTLNTIIPDFQVNENGGLYGVIQYRPSISADDSGNFVITWMDFRNGDWDIYAQRYSRDGSTVGTNFKVNDDQGSKGQYSPSISTDGSGNFVISWSDSSNSDLDIYAQCYSSDGSAVGTNFRVTNTGQGNQYAPDVELWNGRIYNTWTDNRACDTDFDIWANVLDWENATGVSDKEPTTEPSAFISRQNYPNPFNQGTTIQYELHHAVKVKIYIFNMLGKRVKVLENVMQQSGFHTVQWDGKDEQGILLTSGIYICRIQAGAFRQSIKLMLLR